jgi:signal transduction histidine kinase
MNLSEQDLPRLIKKVTIPDNGRGRISRGTGLGLSKVKNASLIQKAYNSAKGKVYEY